MKRQAFMFRYDSWGFRSGLVDTAYRETPDIYFPGINAGHILDYGGAITQMFDIIYTRVRTSSGLWLLQ